MNVAGNRVSVIKCYLAATKCLEAHIHRKALILQLKWHNKLKTQKMTILLTKNRPEATSLVQDQSDQAQTA